MLESHGTTTDSASVIAARQLAQEAQRRRRTLSELHRRHRRPLYVPPLPTDRQESLPE